MIENANHYKGPGVQVYRPSPLANPFSFKHSNFDTVKVADRDEAIHEYEKWLDAQLLDSSSPASTAFGHLLQQLKQNGKLVLICWCVPKRCHADVLRRKLLEAVAD